MPTDYLFPYPPSIDAGLDLASSNIYIAKAYRLALHYIGMTPFDAIGTPTTRTYSNATLLGRHTRYSLVSAAAINSLAALYSSGGSQRCCMMRASSGGGGFIVKVRFASSDSSAVTDARQFVGLNSITSAPTSVEPSTLTNHIGVGNGAADTNLKFYYGGSAAQTPIDLGSDFPSDTAATAFYELTLSSLPGQLNTLNYRLKRLDTGVQVSGSVTATTPGVELPIDTLGLYPLLWRATNAGTAAVGLDLLSYYIEELTTLP